MQYQKVLHPFDLDLTFLAILRKAFEKSEQETNSKGISLDNLTHLIVQTLNIDLNYAHILLRNFDRSLNKRILWRDFLDFLEKEGKLREEIIDLKLYNLSLKRLQEIEKFEIRNQGITLLDTNAMMDNMVTFEVKGRWFFLIFFDDAQIFLFNKNMQYMETFFPLDKHPREFDPMETWEYRITSHENMFYRTSRSNLDSKHTHKTIPSRNSIEGEKQKVGSATLSRFFMGGGRRASRQSVNWQNESMMADSIVDEDAPSVERQSSRGTNAVKRRLNLSLDQANPRKSIARPSTGIAVPKRPMSQTMKENNNPIANLKKKVMEVARASSAMAKRPTSSLLKTDGFEKEKGSATLSLSSKIEEMMKDFPQIERIDNQEQKDIHYLFESFKKASNEKASEIANIGAMAYKSKDYERARVMLNKVTHPHPIVVGEHRSTEASDRQPPQRFGSKFKVDSDRSMSFMFERNVRRDFKRQHREKEDLPNTITIEELKEKFSKVKNNLSMFENMQDTKYLDGLGERKDNSINTSFSRRTQMQKKAGAQAPAAGSAASAEKKFGMYEKYLIIKSKVFSSNCVFHAETGLLAIAFLSREIRIYSPRYKFEDFIFLEKHRLKFFSIPLFMAFSAHHTVNCNVLGVVTEDSIYVFKLVEKQKEFYLEKEPVFKVTPPSHRVKEPAGILFCQSVGLLVVGVNGDTEIYEEISSEDGYYKKKKGFHIKSKGHNHAITALSYNKDSRILGVGNSKGAILLIDPAVGTTRASYNYENIPVVKLHFVTEEKTLIGIYQDKTIVLLNGDNLQVLQVLRDRDTHRPHNFIKTSLYDHKREILMIGGSHAKTYKLQQDPDVELVRREIEMRRHFAPQTYGRTFGAFKEYKYLFNGGNTTELSAIDIFQVFHIGHSADVVNPECLYIVEKNKAVKIYDLKLEKYRFAFFMSLENAMVAVTVSTDGKFVAIADEFGLIKIYSSRSGECVEEMFRSKSDIQLLNFLPKESSYTLISGNSEGEITLHNSSLKITKEKKTHETAVAHLNCIIALDMNSEFIATADETKEVKIWSTIGFQNLSTIRIPAEFDPHSCFEFASGSNPHKGYEGESSIIELRFVKERDTDWCPLLVLESRGCVHILNSREGKIYQIHAVNIGQHACFDLEYEAVGMRLYSFDIDLNIRIMFVSENVELEEFRNQTSQDGSTLNLDKSPTLQLSRNKRVSFISRDERDLSPDVMSSPSNFEGSLDSPTLSRKSTVKPFMPTNTRRRNKAIINRNTSEEEFRITLGGSEKIGWAFYLVKKIGFPHASIPRGVEVKNVQIMYLESKGILITVISHGEILVWNRTGVCEGKLANKLGNNESALPSTVLTETTIEDL